MPLAIRQPRILLALLGSLAALLIALGSADRAQAGWGNYCNPVTLGSYAECRGPLLRINQAYGWGDQHSVCVGLAPLSSSYNCSSGPGAGVYSWNSGEAHYYNPAIQNHAAGNNTVHGIYLFP